MPSLLTYDPIGTLKPVGDAIWIADGPIVHFHYLGVYLPFTTRMTLARLQDGALWVHSPIALTPGLRQEIDSLGPVRHLIAPNSFHYAFINAWRAAYPGALGYGAPRVWERARDNGVALHLDRTRGAAADPAWAAEIDQLVVSGPVMNQAVFLHRPSRTLILTDLIENFEPHRVRNPAYRLLIRLAGAMDPDGKAPKDMQFTFRSRRDELRAAVRTMISWKPQRVLFAHGRWYDRNGVMELERAFRWLAPLAA